MTSNLNLHARLAVERVTTRLRRDLVAYSRGDLTRRDVAVKALRAQSRATRQIAPREADAILGTAALVDVLLEASEQAYVARDVAASDEKLREALRAIDTLRDALGTRG